MSHVRIGSRVFYKDNGPSDTGTIVDVLLEDYPFVVKWDRQKPSEFQLKHLSLPELGVETDIIINPADENIDQFKGDQLEVIEY